MDGYTTGIDLLDRELGDGVPPGVVILFTANPKSQSEEFLYKFSSPRQTLYSTTVRDKQSVKDAIFRTEITPHNDLKIEEHKDSQINEIKDAVMRLEAESTLVVDTVDPIERNSRDDYTYFLNSIQNELKNTQSIIFLHGMKGRDVPDNRTITKQLADIIIDLEQTVKGGKVKTTLTIHKYRGGSIPEEPIKLDLTEGIRIDPSRDIA